MIRGDLMRRGMNMHEVPMRQLFDYIENWEEFAQVENPFMGGDS